MAKSQELPTAPHEIWYQGAGSRLFAVEQGQGLPIVYLHGGLADHQAALFRLGGLAASRRLITPDVRGAGRSLHAGALSWDLLADDVAALLRHLGIERAVVGGSSAGSAIALRFALRYPHKTRALLLISPVYAGDEVGLSPAQRLAMERMDGAGQRALREGIDALLPLFTALPPPIRDVALAMARRFDPASVAATTRFLAAGVQPFARLAELGALSVPTLVVAGADPEHPADVAARYAAAIPGAQLAAPPAELVPVINAFLCELPGLRGSEAPIAPEPWRASRKEDAT
jgi:3-oxoadipate enol-lactonase